MIIWSELTHEQRKELLAAGPDSHELEIAIAWANAQQWEFSDLLTELENGKQRPHDPDP